MSAARAGGLLDKHLLLGAVINSDWSTGLDHKIAWHVIERYRSDSKNGRVALRYLEKATNAKRPSIIASLRRILKSGAISIARKGVGTRPTEYNLNFNFGTKIPSGIVADTSTSGNAGNTSEVSQDIPLDPPSGIAGSTESLLRSPLTSGLTERGTMNDTAAPTAPPLGLAAAADAAVMKKAETPFDELWAAWGRKEKRADARDAYKGLAPDADLHQRLVEAAKEWTESYAATGREKHYQKYLHTWLKGECWLEDLPTAFETKKAAAASGKSAPAEHGASGLTPKTPLGQHTVEVIGSDMEEVGPENVTVAFKYRIHGGANSGHDFSHKFYLNSPDDDVRLKGQSFFQAIREATGIHSPEDTADFHGARLCAVVSRGGKIEYEAA
jgi:hypothetical protein